MSASELIQLIVVALGSGFTVKLLDIVYQEWRQRSDRERTAARFIDEHLDPLLKSADEFVGKVRSLAEDDFRAVHDVSIDSGWRDNHDYGSLLFLAARFWAQIEVIRRDGMSVAMGQDKRGRQLQAFFDCLESRRVRIAARILQRAAGEVFLDQTSGAYTGFKRAFAESEEFRGWLMPLAQVLSKLRNTSQRQMLLQYAVVVHAMIDTLDAKHLITRERPSWPHKLSARSRNDLDRRVFGVYLRFVEGRHKYLGPPRGRPQ